MRSAVMRLDLTHIPPVIGSGILMGLGIGLLLITRRYATHGRHRLTILLLGSAVGLAQTLHLRTLLHALSIALTLLLALFLVLHLSLHGHETAI